VRYSQAVDSERPTVAPIDPTTFSPVRREFLWGRHREGGSSPDRDAAGASG